MIRKTYQIFYKIILKIMGADVFKEQISEVSTEQKESEIKLKNEAKIDEVVAKFGYKLDYIDGKAGRQYVAEDNSKDRLSLFGGMNGTPRDKEITQGDVICEIFENQGRRNPETTKQINKILGTHIPEESFDSYDFENKSLKDLSEYVKYYRYLPYEEYNQLKSSIIGKIRKETLINLDSEFKLTDNISIIGSGVNLHIDGKYINREDKKFGKIKAFNINFNKNKINIEK